MPIKEAFAPANIALSKYWGKRNAALNLPTNSSLSVSLGHLGTTTSIESADEDALFLNGVKLDPKSHFAQKVWRFVTLFIPERNAPILIKTTNNIPTAAGLASSASGFAALTLALNDFFHKKYTQQQLSIIARQGSGSACRSLWQGFVKWQKGEKEDGSDSFAYPIESDWKSLRITVIDISAAQKKTSSTDGMNHTMNTSPFFQNWVQQTEKDLLQIEQAIQQKNFTILGQTCEANALLMHASMISSRPSLCYWLPETIQIMNTIREVRQNGLNIYFTMDAGPNIKLLHEDNDSNAVTDIFPNTTTINPFIK